MIAHEMIAPADVQAVADTAAREARAFVEANKVAVVDLATLTRARDVRTAIAEHTKTITGKLSKPKAWAHGLHKWFCTLEKTALQPFEALDAYEADQIREFYYRETQRRLAEEREIAAQQKRDAEARAASEAAALESAGETAMAAAVVEEAIATPPPVVALPDTVRQIQRFRRAWKWRFVNDDESRALALIPREFLAIDTVKLNSYATNMKGSGRVPGIEFYSVDEPIR